MIKAVLFDLDGTLWDASASVAKSFNIALARLDLSRRITQDEMMHEMGKTLEEIAHVYFDCIDPERAVGIMRYCTAYENSYIETHGGNLYDGLRETLEKLKSMGLLVACVSNCQSGYIEAFMKYHELGDLFDDKECWGDTGLMKADNIALVVKRNGLEPSECVYIGDTMGDYNSAKAAGTHFIHSAYGYGTVLEGAASISAITELPEKIKKF
ncbi:MAG: HAD family hydrolase [Oscillospiraceae bacterium]|nr:HAD family hydrolase [Oscillospiraceae bacterium]